MICIGSSEDINEGASKGFEVNNNYLFAIKREGFIYLYRNKCPHLGTPLEWEEDRFLDSDNALIQCSTHGALFVIETGQCLAGPCKGQYLQSLAFQLVDGLIMVDEKHLS